MPLASAYLAGNHIRCFVAMFQIEFESRLGFEIWLPTLDAFRTIAA